MKALVNIVCFLINAVMSFGVAIFGCIGISLVLFLAFDVIVLSGNNTFVSVLFMIATIPPLWFVLFKSGLFNMKTWC